LQNAVLGCIQQEFCRNPDRSIQVLGAVLLGRSTCSRCFDVQRSWRRLS
jgi:hypothetical protein